MGTNLANREFSFTLKGDVYLRYLSFRDAEEFKTELLRLCPVKMDIGAIYNMRVHFLFSWYS